MRSYIKLDCAFYRHPKAVAAGRDGRDLFVAGLCYAGDFLTDGFVPAGNLILLGVESGVNKVKAAAEALVRVGLWEVVDGGYQAHDYRDYNSGSDEVQAKREAARIRMKRLRSQDVPANDERTEEECSPNVRANNERSSPEVREMFVNKTNTKNNTSINSSADELIDDAPPPPNPKPNPPFELLETLCEAIGSDPSVLSKNDRSRQLAVAKRLGEGGVTAAEVRGMVGYLQNQDWVTGGIDLFLIEKQIGKWKLNGQPNGRASPRVQSRDSSHDRARRTMDTVQNIVRGES